MTKKAENLLNKYEEKIKCEEILFTKGFYDYKKTSFEMLETEKRFHDLLTGLLSYNMLNEDDYIELYAIAPEIRFKALDNIR